MERQLGAVSWWGQLGNFFNRIANPSVFMRFSEWFLYVLAVVAFVCFVSSLYLVYNSPPDLKHGHNVKMMFVHVPAAWISMMGYSVIFFSSIGYFVWRHPLADVSAQAAAPIGAAFTFLALVTGSLWGKPGWGTYWEWGEPRIMSVLILFFLYLGLMALRQAIEDRHQAAISCSVLGMVGFIIVPIIKFSVDWWNTLHQPASVLTSEGSKMASVYQNPLLIMGLGFTLLFFWLHFKKMRIEILRRRVLTLQMSQVERASHQQAAE
ncbi:MAG: heme ABC transporter permease CcmC [Methyloligellaceae bacterium]